MFIHVNSYRRRTLLQAALIATACIATACPAAAQAAEASHAQVVANYGKLPLRFELNRGQSGKRVKFLTRGSGYGLYLTSHDAVLALHKSTAGKKIDVLRVQVAGSHASTQPTGEDRLPGVVNYLQGNDPSSWKTAIPTYSRVRYASVYPGIDLVYYGNQQQLEYDFVVAPQKQAATIRLHFAGARHLKLDAAGNLVIQANEGSIAFRKPVLYQTIDARRHEVPGRFALLADNTVGFRVGAYDHSQSLVIDPTLIYSTYLGGTIQDNVTEMAVDSTGEAYVTGLTLSGYNTAPNFPTTPGAYQTTGTTGYYAQNAFVSKFNASGTALLYSTYFGPNVTTAAIAVDASGNAVIAGTASSSNFPVTSGAYQTTSKTPSSNGTGFITKLNSTGSALSFSTFLGGSTSESISGLVLNSAGNIYVSGTTFSNDFPVSSGAYQTTNKSFASNGSNSFVAELNPTATSLVYATLIGGSNEYDGAPPIHLAIDSSGDAYISGYAISPDFPTTTGAYQTKNPGPSTTPAITLSKFNPTGTKLLYSTFLDGTGGSYDSDQVNGLAVDTSGNLYVAGTTHDSAFPVTTGAFQTTNKSGGGSGYTTGFVAKLNAAGTALVYSTYLGGSATAQGDGLYGLALDTSGNVYVCGQTESTDYPVTSNAYQTTNPANNFDYTGTTPVLSELNPAGTALLYSTYFGGADPSGVTNSIVLGPSSSVFIAGSTPHTLPVTSNAYQTTSTSSVGDTGFVAEFSFGSAPTTLPTATSLLSISNPGITGSNLTFNAYVAPTTGTAIPSGNVVFTIDSTSVATVALNAKGIAAYTTTTPLTLGQHAILASYAGNSTYSASASNLTQNIIPATPIISPASGPYTSAKLVSITDATASASIYYTLDGTTPTASSTKYTAPFLVSTTTLVNAIAIVSSVPSSNVQTTIYSFLSAPSVLAVNATAIGTATATLNALVGTGGMAGSYYFIYGTSTSALTSTSASTSFGGSVLSRLSISPFQATANLTTLQTKTAYYFQIVVTTAAGTSSGQVLSFKTN